MLAKIRLGAFAKLFAALLLTAAYVAVIIVLANGLGVWDLGLAGATVAWSLGSATMLLMNSIRDTQESDYLRRAIVQAAGVAVLIEGLVNLYAFPVYVEFFTLPTIALLAATAAFADGKAEYASVRRLINGLLGTAVGARSSPVGRVEPVDAERDAAQRLPEQRLRGLWRLPAREQIRVDEVQRETVWRPVLEAPVETRVALLRLPEPALVHPLLVPRPAQSHGHAKLPGAKWRAPGSGEQGSLRA